MVKFQIDYCSQLLEFLRCLCYQSTEFWWKDTDKKVTTGVYQVRHTHAHLKCDNRWTGSEYWWLITVLIALKENQHKQEENYIQNIWPSVK